MFADWLIKCLFLLYLSNFINAKDATQIKQAYGSDVVIAAVRRVQEKCIFPNDFLFLRRVAYQESKDGSLLTDKWNNSVGKGGIWQNDDASVNEMQTKNTSSMIDKRNKILFQLGLDILKINRSNGDLEIPLNSAAMSRLYMSNFAGSIPISLKDQAQYWKTNYNTLSGAGTVQQFLTNIAEMNQKYPCKPPGMDIMFIMDSSGSIGEYTFQQAKNFIVNVIKKLDMGEEKTRVGIIDFSDNATVVTSFTSLSNDAILQAQNMPYYGESTETQLALQQALYVFSNNERNPSQGYPWIAIVVTDGAPDNETLAQEAATNLKNAGVTLITVGVGSSIPIDLRNMASPPYCMNYYAVNDYTTLAEAFPDLLNSQTCEVSAAAPTNTNNITATVVQDASVYYRIPANVSTGLTLKIDMENGECIIYASATTTLQSSADYDYSVNATTDRLGQIYISPTDLSKFNFTESTIQLEYNENDIENSLVTVYVGIKGINDNNTFVLTFDNGNTVIPEHNGAISFSLKWCFVFIFIIVNVWLI